MQSIPKYFHGRPNILSNNIFWTPAGEIGNVCMLIRLFIDRNTCFNVESPIFIPFLFASCSPGDAADGQPQIKPSGLNESGATLNLSETRDPRVNCRVDSLVESADDDEQAAGLGV